MLSPSSRPGREFQKSLLLEQYGILKLYEFYEFFEIYEI